MKKRTKKQAKRTAKRRTIRRTRKTTIPVTGLRDSYKVPGTFCEIVFGAPFTTGVNGAWFPSPRPDVTDARKAAAKRTVDEVAARARIAFRRRPQALVSVTEILTRLTVELEAGRWLP
jgi:hypothetical protein